MATDYGEKEREFLDGLKESTGRDLAEWMTVITEKNLPHRNDIIDWLRHQGFMFSQASWLERIHHNGGRPIYADGASANLMAFRPPRERAEPKPGIPANDQAALDEPPQPMPAPARAAPREPPPPPPAAAPGSTPAEGNEDLTPVLAKAKAYRPLAQHLITQIKTVRPDARFLARAASIAMTAPEEFAVLTVTGKELRLYLALGDDEDGSDVVKKAPAPSGLGKGAKPTHMLVLTDARQIDRRLLDIVARAAAKVNNG